jgi:hypothetical protein
VIVTIVPITDEDEDTIGQVFDALWVVEPIGA